MTKLTADWLDTDASKTVTGFLADAGYEVYFVGGCVRNALMGKPASDLDLATNARPDTVMELANAAGLKAIPTGIDHGTVTVVVDHKPYEITTFRKDIETDGRHATVAFSDRLEDDAVRRDFTMNALYCRPDGTVIDPVNGLPDLHARHVRFINDPHDRIREDYLRILRFFRFHAWYGDAENGINADGLAACAEHADGLDGLARERVGPEVFKTLFVKNPAPTVASMSASGVLMRVLPGADAAALAVLVHHEETLGRPPHAFSRLATIFTGDVKTTLRFANEDAREYEVIRDHARSDMSGAEMSYRLGKNLAIECLMVRAALMGSPVNEGEVAATETAWMQQFPIQASDLMPAYEGKALGERLKHLESAWIASDFSLTKDALLALP